MNLFKRSLFAGIICISGFCAVAQQQQNAKTDSSLIKPYVKFDDTRNIGWSKEFEVVEITSSKDKAIQKSYFYKSKSPSKQPLVVSLHTWSGNYTQKDDLANLCKLKDVNYIHPDFRGVNKTPSACCSEFALADIDDAITFAINNANVDTGKIYVIGVSGGGYATLSTYMKSKHPIKRYSAWASITDLESWYKESTELKNKYAQDILDCTNSKGGLNVKNARQRSPLYMQTPVAKPRKSELFIYAGVQDGIKGSVPITHSIHFYNKLLKDLSVKDKSKYVSEKEKLELLKTRKPLASLGSIADRQICLQKEYGSIKLTIFDGEHEMLTQYALDEILKN